MTSSNPNQDVEKFLSAPEELIANPRELAKAQDRKARDEARLKRERATKESGIPSLEDILADVVRVAEDEDTNPQAEFRSISRRRYELYGHYPIEYVLEHGQFAHITQMAGLTQTPTTGRMLKARTEDSLAQHDRRYFDRYMAPHINKFPELDRETQKFEQVVFISDTHSAFCDPFTWMAFIDFIAHSQPEVICLGGDHIDGHAISSHAKPPGFGLKLQDEFDLFQQQVTEIRTTCPNSKIVWVASNHFTDRVVRHLTNVDPALASLRSMRFDKLIDLGGLDVEICMGGSFLAPEGEKDGLGHKFLWGKKLVMTHGTRLGKYPADKELDAWQTNGISGHVHRAQIVRGSTNATRHLTWACNPAGCADACARYYVQSPGPAWQRGFTVVNKGRKSLQFLTVDTTSNEAICEGWAFTTRKKLPSGVEALPKWWAKYYR